MIHYHGSPFSGSKKSIEENKLCNILYTGNGSGGLVNYESRSQLDMILKETNQVVLDNGAYPRYKKICTRLMKEYQEFKKISDIPPDVYLNYVDKISFDWDKHWLKVYMWINQYYSSIDWFIIPDVIFGTEEENNRQLNRCPDFLKDKGAPVWHTTESIERFITLCEKYDRVCIGACGPHYVILSDSCQRRLEEAFTAIYIDCDIDVKIHGLRMLDNRVVSRFPFDSCDSTKVVRCEYHTRENNPEIKGRMARTAIFKNAIEITKSPPRDEWVSVIKSGRMYPMPRRFISKKPQHEMKFNQWEIPL